MNSAPNFPGRAGYGYSRKNTRYLLYANFYKPSARASDGERVRSAQVLSNADSSKSPISLPKKSDRLGCDVPRLLVQRQIRLAMGSSEIRVSTPYLELIVISLEDNVPAIHFRIPAPRCPQASNRDKMRIYTISGIERSTTSDCISDVLVGSSHRNGGGKAGRFLQESLSGVTHISTLVEKRILHVPTR